MVAKVNIQSKLERMLQATKAGVRPHKGKFRIFEIFFEFSSLTKKVSGNWMFSDGDVVNVTIEDTMACTKFSYCDETGLGFFTYFLETSLKWTFTKNPKSLECNCIYGYQRSLVDGLCHEPKLKIVLLILLFAMGILLYITDYAQWWIRERFLPAID